MALETSLLVNGTWTTRTIDLDSVLRHHEEKDKEPKRMNLMETQDPPEYGLLTQTIICSPLVHWILPVSLRSPGIIDIAFIGDEFVQIRELRPNGHLCDVIRREHFGARIRNARVVGSLKAYSRDAQASSLDSIIKIEKDNDSGMKINKEQEEDRQTLTKNLPPQFILLQLETGDSIFLMLRRSGAGDLEFVVRRHSLPENSMLLLQPGTHLTVDPSSRYMAVGCSERQFAIYALHPREKLKQRYSEGDDIEMVESQTVVTFHGIIHKMEFLFPSADDEDHIILLILVVHKGKTRMVVYEWETGADLDKVTPHSYKGHLLAKSREAPLLLIPLTIKSAFILVCEDSMTICQGLLQGSPMCIDFNTRLDRDRPTLMHHGISTPLWTSWTRPSRLPHHTASRDDLYIVREDGLVKFLEIDADADDFIRADMNIGQLGRNNGTALASVYNENLDDSTKTGDLLITGGDSCPGGTYMVRARQSPVFLQKIQNWSPSVDFTTTAISEDRNYIDPPSSKSSVPRSDRIFSCGGKGAQGAITEFRYGVEASLGLEVDYQSPISNAWVLQPEPYSQLFKDDASLFLLSLADRSALLQLSNDASDIVEVDQELTPFDLGSRTITSSASGDGIIQVTERSIIFISEDDVRMYSGQEILGSANAILDAVIYDNMIFYTAHAGTESLLNCVMQKASDAPAPGARQIFRTLKTFSTSITCVDVFTVDGQPWLIVAGWDGSSVDLSLKPIYEGGDWHKVRLPLPPPTHPKLEAINSISVASGLPDNLILLCGTRNGFVVTIQLNKSSLEVRNTRWDRFGANKASITKDHYFQSPDEFFVTCDSKIYSIIRNSSYNSGTSFLNRYWAINQIWVTNVLDPALAQPNIDSITRLPTGFLRGSEDRTLLLVSGSQLMLAGLAPRSTAVPRHIPIRGTPSRILYSHALGGILIVGASIERKSTLLFIDPDTGVDISMPVDKKGDPVDFVSGLGNTNERIFGLFEWPYTKDGRTWHFLIVCTSSGRLLIISFDRGATSSVRTGEADNSTAQDTRKIRYWTRYKYKTEEPIYSVTGYPSGLCYCSGNRLYFETLDLTERKFKKISEFWLPSLARVLSHEDSNIYALTSNDSLQILKLVIPENPEEESYQTLHTHSDKETRSGLDHKLIGVEHPISLVSDKDCSVAGQWASQNTKSDTLINVFEAALPYSVLKFHIAKSRPIWDHSWYMPPIQPSATEHQDGSHEKTSSKESYHMDIIPSTRMHGEVLGLSIDGSLSHFTMIGVSAWRFLRYLYNLAIKSPMVAEFVHGIWKFPLEPATDPKIMMHVDGDILRHCLEGRKLEKLVCMGAEDEGEAEIFNTFCELLRDLHRGEVDRYQDARDYVEQAYEDLEFYLRPVL
ncbi:mono-functional DNA-alkylating methyl methanesulfonate N-term-domain-containing protein [Xylogone sp. PMI_703]|nr:mono-functional DNA-alkylating methyl methanesulfonate N-term-domain-containing protein [Xylogone sp. PMI_703]